MEQKPQAKTMQQRVQKIGEEAATTVAAMMNEVQQEVQKVEDNVGKTATTRLATTTSRGQRTTGFKMQT